MANISQSVGIRFRKTILPNNQNDVETVIRLLDNISIVNGGTERTVAWKKESRRDLITQVTEAIEFFQKKNKRPVVDSAVDPGGGSLRLMNQLSGEKNVSATVHKSEDHVHFRWVASPNSLNGSNPARTIMISSELTLKLIRVEGTSIKWFGVVIPKKKINTAFELTPHIFFTPSPYQGKYFDPGYENFESWTALWRKYSFTIGSQIAFADVSQILVIPFYKNIQTGNLGNFLTNWKEVISEVITTAVLSVDAGLLRKDFQFDQIFTSSFSNGIASHQSFASGKNVASAIKKSFDLDGQASGSKWHPPKGIIYSTNLAPKHGNPIGNTWFVGRRLDSLSRHYPGVSEHDLSPNLLFHGLSTLGK